MNVPGTDAVISVCFTSVDDFSVQNKVSHMIPYAGKKYYEPGLFDKQDIATVYINAFLDNNLMGIQYWFYYPFHDDPRVRDINWNATFHVHDWWYVWIVYDQQNKQPSKVVFDFHHNLRAYDWNHSRVYKSGFHVKVWIDAGGHRAMFAPGGDIDAGTVFAIWFANVGGGLSIYDMMKKTGEYGYTCSLVGAILDIAKRGDIVDTDELLGIMVKKEYREMGYPASWRVRGYLEWPGTFSYYAVNAEYRTNEDYNTWKVENFIHWVWVYGVERDPQPDPQNIKSMGYDQSVVKVQFTGDNIYTDSHGDMLPAGLYEYDTQKGEWVQKINFHLPWLSGYTIKDSKYISTTELVWDWEAYYYQKDGTKSPTAQTRYYDGSGP